ncbi:MAG: hypothetical protein E7076_09230 [Bacteroidales bacterium]|nr:hypothetical protein [Bacteroidales bacterium]
MTPHLLQHICHHTQISLKHPFDDCYGRAAKDSRGTTPLLMDYTDGTHIAKWQWSEIYQPALIGAVFEREERGFYVTDYCWKSYGKWKSITPQNLYGKQDLYATKACACTERSLTYYELANGDVFLENDATEKFYLYVKSSNTWKEVKLGNFENVSLKKELENIGERILTDVVLSDESKAIAKIGAGIIAVAAAIPSGGTSLTVLGALGVSFGVTSAVYTTASGVAELTLALSNKNELIDKLPNGYLNATVGVTLEYYIDDPNKVEKMHLLLDFSENIIQPVETLNKISLKCPLSDAEKINTIISTGNINNITIDSYE